MSDALREHVFKEKASFHTPGHKGYAWQSDGSFTALPALKYDLTELPGLDELGCPTGVIQGLEKRAAEAWGAQSTLLSVSGATAGIIATTLMLVGRGTHLLVPRNCHRSVIHGLVLSGLEPIWFEPKWESEWGLWGAPDTAQLSEMLKDLFAKNQNVTSCKVRIAGMFITSPTYTGALADIEWLSDICSIYKIPLLVDEAWGEHLYWTEQNKQAALDSGASIVIHSLHKTLSCPTQTGLVHISKKGAQEYGFSESELRACMNLIQSSSPNYIFMGAIDKLVLALSSGKAQEQIHRVEELGKRIKDFFSKTIDLSSYESHSGNALTHFLIKHKDYDPKKLQDLLIGKGIFPEMPAGLGLLFLLGIGSQTSDIVKLEMALKEIIAVLPKDSKPLSSNNGEPKESISKPREIDQAMNPRKAFFMPSHIVSTKEAIGQISAECLAPCPPGWAILVPGQRITEEILAFENIKSVRIVKTDSQFNNV